MRFNVITLFPNMISQALQEGVVGQSVVADRLSVKTVNPRDFTTDIHHSVDDRPFGGGDGMVMMVDPLIAALESLGSAKGHVVLLSPQGHKWEDQRARQWAERHEPVTLICGRYAGLDQRFINHYVDEEFSIGDYVLSGGELAALVIVDTVARFVPEVLGNPKSAGLDSFAQGLLEAPLYTRPSRHALGPVPNTLLSGHHSRIQSYREALALAVTAMKRPDLLVKIKMSEERVRAAANELLALPEDEIKSLGLKISDLEKLANHL